MYQKNRCCWNHEDKWKRSPKLHEEDHNAKGETETNDHVVES